MKCKNCNSSAYLEMVDFTDGSTGFREKHECTMCEQVGWRNVNENAPNTYEGCLVGDSV